MKSEWKPIDDAVDAHTRAFREFRDEISDIYEKEKKDGKTADFTTYSEFDPEALTTEDMAIYQRIRNSTVQEEEFVEYRARVLEEAKGMKSVYQGAHRVPGSREIFLRYLQNLVTPVFLMREFEEKKKGTQSGRAYGTEGK